MPEIESSLFLVFTRRLDRLQVPTQVGLDFVEENVDRLGVREVWEKVRTGFSP